MPSENMPNNKGTDNKKEQKRVTRKEFASRFKKARDEAKDPEKKYREEYQEIIAAMMSITDHVRKAPIGKVNEKEIKENQSKFLGDMESLLEELRSDIGTEETRADLKREQVEQIGIRIKQMQDSFARTNLVNNAEVSDPFRELSTKLIGIYNREHKAYLERFNKENNDKVQSSPLMMLNDTLMEHPRHMDYPGVNAIQTLVSLPAEEMPEGKKLSKEEVTAINKRMSAHAGVSNSARRLAVLICPMHAPDKNGNTKNLSHKDLTGLKAAYDDLLEKIKEYQDALPKEHEYQKQLTEISANMAKERTQVERAIKGIEDYVKESQKLKDEARPFSIYEIQGRTNPEFNNGFFKKAQAVKRTGDAFRERVTQWKQDAGTKEMLKDYDDMMAAFDRLTTEVLPQLMKLDRGDRGYLPAMTPNEVADLRDVYQDAVIKIDQFVKTYGRKPKNEEQKDFQQAIFELYPDMVNKFRMLDQLVGGEDVRDLTEAVSILNEKREDLAKKEPPKKEKDKKEQEQELINLTEEEQRLKDVGYYQTLLDDGQLFPQMLFDSSESQRSADLAAMRRESQVLSGARKDFNAIMTRNRRMRACPDTAVLDAALAVNPEYPPLDEETKVGFDRHFEELKRQVLELSKKMTEFYEEDENGRTKLLNLEEIREFEKAYSAISSEAFMCDGWLPEGDPRKAAFQELDDLCEARKKSLRAAGEYIRKNAPEYREANADDQEIIPRTRAFSLYELQGGINPEIDNNALDEVARFKEEMDAFELSLNKLTTRQLKQMNPIRAEYKTFAREIDNLYNKVVPELLRMDPGSNNFANPVTRDKVKEAMKEFEKATMAFIPLQVDYNNRKKEKNANITKEEEKMFATAAQLYLRASQKWLAMNYLLDRTGEELMQDVERHNEQYKSLKEDIDKLRENQKLGDKKLSDEQLAKDKVLKHDAKFLAWAMQLEDLFVNKKLTTAALFEEDPSIGRSQIMGELRLTEQNIYDVQMRAFYIGSQRWGQGGRRDLGDVKEFQTSLHQRNEFGTHTVMQYATKKRQMAKSIIDAALRHIPEKIKTQQFDIVIGEKEENGKKVPETQKMTVEEAIRFYYQKKVDQMPDKSDLAMANDINNNGIYAYETSGFAKAFKKEDLKNNRALSYFVCDLNRALLNAGCCTDTMDLNLNDNIPDGYNQAYAKVAAQALINDLAMQRTPEKGKVVIEERVDKDGNKPAANLLPATHLWEQTKFQFGDARPDQAFDVVIASTEKNFSEQVPGDKTKEFYTTTKNFRSSSFVGFIPTSVVQAPQYRDGMTAMELAQAEEDITQFLYDQHTGQNKKADPVTSDVDDYVAYTDPTVLANVADLQVMGYVLGIPKYRADQLRIGFKLDEKGNVYVSNVLGAETDEYLFSDLAPNDPSLVSPDNMLVMTKEMANKIIDWSQGRFDANDRAVREAFKRLPQKALIAFQNRVNVMAAMIQKSRLQQDQFEDVVDEDRKPGQRPLVGLHTKPGVIRFLDRRDFDQLKLDDLAIGRNSGDYRTRETKPPVNIFDAVADLPKQSHLALMDKWGAIWGGDKSKEYGHLPESAMGKNSYRRNVHEPLYERKYLESERRRFLSKTARMIGDVIRMDTNRKKESIFHWDTGKYSDVLKAQEELQKQLVLFDLDYTISSSQKRVKMIRDHREAVKNKDNYYARCAQVREQNRKIALENKKIAEENKKIADKSKHKKEIPYVALPKRDRDADNDSQNLRYSLDYRDMKPVRDAMLKFKKKLEIYLAARVNPSSEFGKMRYATMLKMYNDINDRLADYVINTGDTTVQPSVAKLTEIPPKNGQPVPEDKKKYKITFESMMEPGEWELRIPDVVREDYIRAVRMDIREKGDNNKKKTPQQVLAEADLAEKLIRKRYTEAQKTYDLNGRKKGITTLTESFEILDEAEHALLKKTDPARLRPVLLKKQKQPAPQAPKISREEQQRQANAEYERLMKGGKAQGGFDFAALSGEAPVPEPQPQKAPTQKVNAQGPKIIVDPLKEQNPQGPKNDQGPKIIVDPLQQNPQGPKNDQGPKIIVEPPKAPEVKEVKPGVLETNFADILNKTKANAANNQNNQGANKGDKGNNKETENKNIINVEENKKEPNGKVSDTTFDAIFDMVLDNKKPEDKKFQGRQEANPNTNTNTNNNYGPAKDQPGMGARK